MKSVIVTEPPVGLAATNDALWLSTADGLFKIDPSQMEATKVLDRKSPGVALADRVVVGLFLGSPDIAVTQHAVWFPDPSQHAVLRIDPINGKVIATIPVESPTRMFAADGVPWMLQVRRSGLQTTPTVGLTRIDPETNQATSTVPLPALASQFPHGALVGWRIAIGEGSLWAVGVEKSTVVRIDLNTGATTAKINVSGADSSSLAVVHGQVWLADDYGTLTRIEPRTNSVIAKIENTLPTNGNWHVSNSPDVVGGEILMNAPIVFDRDSVWTVGTEKILKLDSNTNRIVATVPTYDQAEGASQRFAYDLPAPNEPGTTVDACTAQNHIWLLRLERLGSHGRSKLGVDSMSWVYGIPTSKQ
jgi:hypothetical protein